MQRHAVTSYNAPTACRRMGSGSISLFLSKFFSPFPHGTGTLSVSWEYLALPDGPGRFTQDYTCPALLRILLCLGMLRIKGFHLLWLNFPEYSSRNSSTTTQSYNPNIAKYNIGLGQSPFARHYQGIISLFSLPRGTKMFQFPRFASYIIYMIITLW